MSWAKKAKAVVGETATFVGRVKLNLGSRSTPQSVRVVIFKYGDQWMAQCLEHDICAMADNLDTLRLRLGFAVEAELALCKSEGRDLNSLPKAPERFFTLWDRSLGGVELQGGPVTFSYL